MNFIPSTQRKIYSLKESNIINDSAVLIGVSFENEAKVMKKLKLLPQVQTVSSYLPPTTVGKL